MLHEGPRVTCPNGVPEFAKIAQSIQWANASVVSSVNVLCPGCAQTIGLTLGNWHVVRDQVVSHLTNCVECCESHPLMITLIANQLTNALFQPSSEP